MASVDMTRAIAAGFDDRNVTWQSLPGPGNEGFVMAIFNVDPARNSADFLIRFDPNTKVMIHRHLATTHTFVIEGDHVIYEPDGSLRESRPVGRYTVSGVTGDVHSEGGGPNGCTLMYSVRGHSDEMFDLIDADMQELGKLRVADFVGLVG